MGGENIQYYKSLFLYWKIGKKLINKKDVCWNPVMKYASLCSYKFGASELFSSSNIRYMEKFYKCFPIYYKELNRLTFEHYKLLVDIYELESRYFYYRVALFCRSSVWELKQIISNDIYFRI